ALSPRRRVRAKLESPPAPVRNYPAPGTQAQTLVIPSAASSTWVAGRLSDVKYEVSGTTRVVRSQLIWTMGAGLPVMNSVVCLGVGGEGIVRLAVVADFISVPFYDLFHENGHVPKIRRNLPPLLTGVRRSILEVGAGTGLITTSLADWTPAEIFALEPSAGMRGILLSRLNSRPELLNRATVLPCDALSVTLDEP